MDEKNGKKKVVIVGTAYPYRGGLAAFNERLAYQFISDGYEVEIYTFTLQYPNFLFPGKTQYSEELSPNDLKIYRKINSINVFNWIKVGREIKKKNPDILITKFWIPYMAPCLGTIERIVRKNCHTKIISIVDNIIPHEHRIGDKLLSNYFVKSTQGFIAMSRSVLKELGSFITSTPAIYSPHPLYDHYGVKLSKKDALAKLNLDSSCRYVLFFGIIRGYKGLDLLLSAFAKEKIKNLNIKLIVAGEFYDDPAPYHKLISDLSLADNVILKSEFIPENEVNTYFSAVDIVSQTYKSATQSGVTQIAYHFNCPMLVTDVGGLSEIVPDGRVGYVVDVNVDAIADALFDFFSKDREEEFVKNVVAEKQRFSWENLVDAIEKLCNDIN